MMTEKPSSQAPQLPVTPHMLYPRGGIRVCLQYHRSARGEVAGCGGGGNVRVTAVGVPEQGGPPPQAGQHLDGVDPEAGADKEARDVLAAADICIARSGLVSGEM